MRLVVLDPKGLWYNSKRYEPGEEFESRKDEDARVLKAIGKAADAPAVAPPVYPRVTRTGRFQRRDMRAAEEPTAPADPPKEEPEAEAKPEPSTEQPE